MLLSAGVDFDSFKRQMEIACKAGASAFLGGPALWQEGAQIASREERIRFFRNTAGARLKELVRIADSHGTPWYFGLARKNGKCVSVGEDWYRNY